jgi:flagellin
VSVSGQYNGNDKITITGNSLDLRASTLTVATDPDTLANAQSALAQVDVAITAVNSALGTIGSLQSRIDTATENVRTSALNFSAAESTIRDLDMAMEMTHFSKNQILVQTGTAMLAQANQFSQNVLTLLRG